MTQTMPPSDISAEQVSRFLIENPTFFLKNEHLLADLYLPHGNGSVVSLQERQVGILRERNIDMRKRLNEFIEQGQRNDVLYKKTTVLILNLLEAKSLDELIKRLVNYCEKEFQVDFVQFSLFTHNEYRHTQCRVVSSVEAERVMPSLLRNKQCISGIFREEELSLLFAQQANEVESAIVLPMTNGEKTVAILAMGSADVHYFKAGMNTLFLGFIGDAMSRLLQRFA